MKYSKIDGVVQYSGGMVVLREGLSADDEHPLVQERPDLFGDEAPRAELSVDAHPATFIGRQEPKPVVEADGTEVDVPEQDEASKSGEPVVVDRTQRRRAVVRTATARPGAKQPAEKPAEPQK